MMNPKSIPPSQLLEALSWRYATKAFDAKRKIPAEVWSALEDALILSPSSFGLQPYRFLVVHDPLVRERLLPHAWGQRQVADASHFVVFAARTSVTKAEIDSFIALIARTRGVTPESLANYHGMMTSMLLSDSFRPIAVQWSARQAYIALGNLLSSAALLGIDACPMEGFVPVEFDKVLGLPAQGLTAVVCCALGYRHPEDQYAAAPKVRFAKNQLVLPM
jgi:nitroreductase